MTPRMRVIYSLPPMQAVYFISSSLVIQLNVVTKYNYNLQSVISTNIKPDYVTDFT